MSRISDLGRPRAGLRVARPRSVRSDEDRGEERDEDADGRRVQLLRELHLDEGADAGDVDRGRFR